ncbi:MAG: LPP20 family lipoprotein [Nitrospinae bacterium]|nr:LPP20 family lipoprotein [Nitrospinota bacterium]
MPRRTAVLFFAALASLCVSAGSARAANCSYLPESPMPAWVEKRPEMPGYYVGVGVAGPMREPQEQIDASQANALTNLGKEITVTVKSTFTDIARQEGRWSDQEITAETETRVTALLRGAKTKEKWLDRKNCQLWTLVTVSREDVAAVQKEMEERARKQFTSKSLMLFPLAHPDKPDDLERRVSAAMGKVMRDMGVGMVTPEIKYLPCAQGTYSKLCDGKAETIYGGFTLEFDKEKLSADGQYKARFYFFKGALYFKDRTVSVIDVKCRGVGGAAQDADAIGLIAADQCVADIRKKLERDMQGSE